MSDPLAYFITFRTYGTWLPGDERGAVDRRHNQYATPRMTPDVTRERDAQRRQTQELVLLTPALRAAVENALRAVCAYRQWHMHALNVRSNHVHVVVYARAVRPERVMNDFKAYATRALRLAGLTAERVWERHGSTRHVYDAGELASAMDYVLNRQG